MIFDGRKFAHQRELQLQKQLRQLPKKPRILSFLVGQDPPSLLYTRLKRQAAQRVGFDFQVLHFTANPLPTYQTLIEKIKILAPQFDGLMVQLPLPDPLKPYTKSILSAIPLEKDIDGLRWQQSHVIPATVRAILTTLETIQQNYQSQLWKQNFVVVGAKGTIGQPLVYFLYHQKGVKPKEVDLKTPQPTTITRQADVLISCTGQPHLIKPNWVKPNLIAIDVGISKVNGKTAGDFDPHVYQLAKIALPVPGGIGPITIVSLLENSLDLYRQSML